MDTSTTTFNGAFGSVENGSNSSEHTFTVAGTGLSANLVVTAPTGFQVSKTSGSGFASSVSFTPSSNAVATSTVYARFSPNAVSSFSGNITVASTGATTFNVAVNGMGTAVTSPTITIVGTFTTAANQVISTASNGQEILVEGANLSAGITVTAPAQFEVSKTDANSAFAPSQTLASNYSGSVWIRYNPAATGSHSGNVTFVSTGATTQNVSVAGNAIAAEPASGATNVTFTDVTGSSFTVQWTNGGGANRIVVLRAGNAVNADPSDAATYTANAAFGSGTQIGTGNYVVYGGSGTSVAVSGLSSGTTYHVAVYEFNGSGGAENYRTTSPATGSQATSALASHVVIAEIYGGGGNSGATYSNDYVVLYNPTVSAVDVSAWSLQYASTSGSFTNNTNLTGSIAAHGYYLVQLGSGGANGAALPVTAVVSNSAVNMSATNGKVALVSNQTSATGIADPDVVDFVGFGTANEHEGAAASSPSATASLRRKDNSGANTYGTNGNGWDTNDNATDFYVETDIATHPPMPVELVSFTATAASRGVELRWNTATEVNNQGFVVERIVEGKSQKEKGTSGVWESIGFVEGHGTVNAPQSYTFADPAARGTVRYRLKQVDRDGAFQYSGEAEATASLTAADFALSQNFPNPFNPSTSFTFAVRTAEHAVVSVYDLLGKEVARLYDGTAPAGELVRITFHGTSLASGLYLYQLRTPTRTEVRKMLLMK